MNNLSPSFFANYSYSYSGFSDAGNVAIAIQFAKKESDTLFVLFYCSTLTEESSGRLLLCVRHPFYALLRSTASQNLQHWFRALSYSFWNIESLSVILVVVNFGKILSLQPAPITSDWQWLRSAEKAVAVVSKRFALIGLYF